MSAFLWLAAAAAVAAASGDDGDDHVRPDTAPDFQGPPPLVTSFPGAWTPPAGPVGTTTRPATASMVDVSQFTGGKTMAAVVATMGDTVVDNLYVETCLMWYPVQARQNGNRELLRQVRKFRVTGSADGIDVARIHYGAARCPQGDFVSNVLITHTGLSEQEFPVSLQLDGRTLSVRVLVHAPEPTRFRLWTKSGNKPPD